MVVIKCKMCGGNLDVQEGLTVCECEYCGTKQTLPNMDDEKKLNLFGRANRLRMSCEFDKAAGVYESIVSEFPEEAEAYWGLVLCKYGIEYVDDPTTAKKVPTCHRSSFESVMDDNNFEQVMENSDAIARKVYREEAKVIEEIRKGIIEVSSKEAPYDIFICYKETDAMGQRTIDSVIAQDVYDALTEKGYRIFFSRITLEDKLGQEYEPYIFAALHSAKVMLVFGTDYEYYNAVWVKNEWSRFLQLMAKGEKKTLIPCYKGIDAYDMPKEFAKLQAQDMGKVGAIQDLLRGIEKIVRKDVQKVNNPSDILLSNEKTKALNIVKLGFLDFNSGNEEAAKIQFRKALESDSSCITAYIGLCLLEESTDIEKQSYSENILSNAPEITEEEKDIISEKTAMKYLLFFLEYISESRVCYVLKHNIDVNSRILVNGVRLSLLNYAILLLKSDRAVKVLIKSGADIHNAIRTRSNGDQHSALSDAIGVKAEMVQMLLEAGADPNITETITNDDETVYKRPLLTKAIIYAKSSETVKLLLEYGADPNNAIRTTPNGDQYSALSDAICNAKDVEMVRMLLEAGADANRVEAIDTNGTLCKAPVLSCAIFDANTEMVRLMIEHGADVNKAIRIASDGNQYSALRDALCNAKDVEMVRMLLEAGADANRIETLYNKDGKEYKSSMLSDAINDAESLEMVKLLLEYGADPNNAIRITSNGNQYSALRDALCNAKDVEMVRMLLEAGADANRIENLDNGDGNTYKKSMLSYAINNAKSSEMVHLLLEYGADVNKPTYVWPGGNQNSALGDSFGTKDVEMVRMLLEAGADANRIEIGKDKNGRLEKIPMLAMAILHSRNPEIVNMMLMYGASWDEVITLDGVTKTVRKYPFDKKYCLSNEFSKYLKSRGWKGSIIW